MSRSIDGTKRKNRRKKILKLAKGFKGDRKSNYKAAKDAVTRSLSHAYEGRKQKKRDYRSLWITRISAAVASEGLTYSKFINCLSKAGVKLNRKTLSNMANEDPAAFKAVVNVAKSVQQRA